MKNFYRSTLVIVAFMGLFLSGCSVDVSPDKGNQRTLASAIVINGVGLANGSGCSVEIYPAQPDYGIRFFAKGRELEYAAIKCNLSSLKSAFYNVTLSNKVDSVANVEYLLAALSAFGIYNAKIVVRGGEIPVLDGTEKELVNRIRSAGVKDFLARQKILAVRKTVSVGDGKKFISVSPDSNLVFELSRDVPWDNSMWEAHQSISMLINEDSFTSELIGARKYLTFKDKVNLDTIHGLQGLSTDNVLVMDRDSRAFISLTGLNDRLEFVKHDAIILLGIATLVGMPVIGRFKGSNFNQEMAVRLLKKLLSDPSNYEIVSNI